VAPEYRISIEEHTDRGRADVNQKLSLKLAEAVRDYLEEAGISPAMIAARDSPFRPLASIVPPRDGSRTAAWRS
jgi:hypothetical protein